MRLATLMRPEGRAALPPPSLFLTATSVDALSWMWDGDAVTAWRIKWGAASGVYTDDYDVTDPSARAAMFTDFLASSGEYYVAVYAVDGGGEGDHVDEVAIRYTT